MIYVIRNNQTFGPYELTTLKNIVENGKLLTCDKAYDSNEPAEVHTVGYFLKRNHIKVKIKNKGNLFSQIKAIGSELILPKEILKSKTWKSDRRLLLLALIGLTPLALMYIIHTDLLVFYAISLYFSVIWGLFFYYFFKTKQVNLRTTLTIFFLTQIFVFVIWGFGLNEINLFYFLESSDGFFMKLLFFVFAVGVTEELTKAIPLFILTKRAKEPLIPQTLVFYGLMSGIAFSVFEGVQYQMNENALMEYSVSFFANIARLTSLPFLHAIWCGLGGYFIAFAKLYPKYRLALYTLAIAIPAALHGIYDTFCSSLAGLFISLPITFLAVVLLMTYLKNGPNYQSKLRE